MIPRASRAVAVALARRASAAAASSSCSSEPIAAAAAVARASPLAASAAARHPLLNLWQARALASSSSTTAAAAAAAASSPVLRAWRPSAPHSQQPQQRLSRSFAAAASGGGKEGDEGKDAAADAADAADAAAPAADADAGSAAAAGEGGGSDADNSDNEKLKEIEELKKRSAALAERLQYALAEAENVRQRARREIETKSQFAVADLAKQLLDVADNLWRAEEAVPKPVRDALFGEGGEGSEGAGDAAAAVLDAPKATALLKALLVGLRATDRGLHELLRKQGIERYDPTGEPFDPNLHAAMFQVPTADAPPGTVAAVHRRGYKMRERVLRAAEVGVAREP